MGKWWSLLFGSVMLACLLLFMVAPFVGWWLPRGVSTHSWDVDWLFYIILYITGFFFVLTEAILVVFLFKYAGRPQGTPAPVLGGPNFFQKMFPYFNNPHRVEMAWTVVPAVILLYVAFAQVGTWLEIKDRSRTPKIGQKGTPLQVHVSARQFEWRIRYPSPKRLKDWLDNPKDEKYIKDFQSFARYPQMDDIKGVPNELHVWKDQTVLVQLETLDVIHSFNIPHMRVKQDALPGKIIPVWFTPILANTREIKKEDLFRWEDRYNPETKTDKDKFFRWEIACAELCGWGHHRMIGRVYVHETKESFDHWLEQTAREQVSSR